MAQAEKGKLLVTLCYATCYRSATHRTTAAAEAPTIRPLPLVFSVTVADDEDETHDNSYNG